MGRYVEKKRIFESFQFGVDDYPDWFLNAIEDGDFYSKDKTIYHGCNYCCYPLVNGEFVVMHADGEYDVYDENCFKNRFERVW